MDANYYQEQARKTAKYPGMGNNIYYPTLGLCGEAGEVAEKVKKVMRDENCVFSDEKKLEIAKELGDAQWYISQAAEEINFKLSEIMQMNLDKLSDRKERDVISGSGDNR